MNPGYSCFWSNDGGNDMVCGFEGPSLRLCFQPSCNCPCCHSWFFHVGWETIPWKVTNYVSTPYNDFHIFISFLNINLYANVLMEIMDEGAHTSYMCVWLTLFYDLIAYLILQYNWWVLHNMRIICGSMGKRKRDEDDESTCSFRKPSRNNCDEIS